MNVKGGKIANYQICTPSTWDIGRRVTTRASRGPMEEALIGAPCVDPEKPMEARASSAASILESDAAFT